MYDYLKTKISSKISEKTVKNNLNISKQLDSGDFIINMLLGGMRNKNSQNK